MKMLLATIMSLFLVVNVCEAGKLKAPPPGKGFLAGKVHVEMKNGKPLSRAIISIFDVTTGPPPDNSAIRRVPDGIIRVKRSGQFRIMLPPGKYYLGVLFRKDIKRNGPPGADEKYFFPRDKEGKLLTFGVVAGKTTKIGDLSGTEPENTPGIANPFTVEGTLLDEQGKPFAGALIMVREKLTEPKPLYISARTGADGKYQLKLPPGGPYFLVARENFVSVGRPRPGDFVGTYGGSPPKLGGEAPSVFSGGKGVSGAAKEILSGADITMYRIPDPEEVKKRLLEESETPTFPGRGNKRSIKPERTDR